MDFTRTIRYSDIEHFDQETLEHFLDNPMGLIASCEFKMEFANMRESVIHRVYPPVGDTNPELPEHEGYELEITMVDGSVLKSARMLTDYNSLTNHVQVQYMLAEDIIVQMKNTG